MIQFQPRGVLWVVVLGDFGRSPRMQYHCMSLLTEYDVNVHVFAQSNELQGIIPELLDAKASGRLKLWQILQMYAFDYVLLFCCMLLFPTCEVCLQCSMRAPCQHATVYPGISFTKLKARQKPDNKTEAHHDHLQACKKG